MAAEPKTFCFDLDGTLCTNTHGDYEAAKPFPWAIERVNALAAAGHRILIFTARGATTGVDWREVTKSQLARWGVRYEELITGKPGADVYVDDRALHVDAWRYSHFHEVPGGAGPAHAEFGSGPALAPPRTSAAVEVGRTFAGEPFRPSEHAGRVQAAARAAAIPVEHEPEEIEAAIVEATVAGRDLLPEGDDVIFSVALAGPANVAHLDAASERLEPSLTVSCRLLSQAASGLVRLQHADRPWGVAASARGGTTSPGAWPLAERGGALVDMLGGELWAVASDGSVIAPAPNVPFAREVAAEAGLRPAAGRPPVEPAELILVGMPFCVLPVLSLDGREIGRGKPGHTATALAAAWSRVAGIDVRAQLEALVERTPRIGAV